MGEINPSRTCCDNASSSILSVGFVGYQISQQVSESVCICGHPKEGLSGCQNHNKVLPDTSFTLRPFIRPDYDRHLLWPDHRPPEDNPRMCR